MAEEMSASDIAAWWGAVIATLVFALEVYKWKQTGPRLRISVSPGMTAQGNVPNVEPNKKYVSIQVVNLGDKKTELTHVVGLYYKSAFQLIRGRNEKSFVVINPAFSTQFPRFLLPGERWVGGIEQSQELEELSRSGILRCGVFHSASTKALTKRVLIRANTAT